MTNGDKLKSDFPYIEIKGQDEVFTAIQIDTTGTGTPIIVYTDWLNAEYEEPTNDNCAIRNGCLTCSLDDGDDCCRKLYEESMEEPTTNNDLGVDCIDRQAAITFVCKNTEEILKDTMPLEVKLSDDYLYENVAKIMRNPKVLTSVTPISKAYSDCISRADARKAIIDHQYSDSFCEEHNIDHSINTSMALIALSDLPSVTPQYQKEHEKLERIKEIMSHGWTCWTLDYIQRVLDGTEDRY